ncbi:hypothetical protein [Rhodoferax fermentans]|uniref:Uncharacterized protein n=1 Tax=Rhodoferax fermentans TaxID=28066 RepID=A0A1T1ANQ5_RHOFE|nr:hypothetical protein [Rhodoferax fermentans]OOV05739.1 hypothetical protein RF819_02600 [Rhodoferax fermentans]
MKNTHDILDLRVPSGKTVLMQHLQTLVLRGNPHWIGGVISPAKLPALAAKLAARYPVQRDERGRTYDRSKGLASAHFVAFPAADGAIAWWVLTSDGLGGLADNKSPDAHVAKHALRANGHIEFDDYVLLYAHKKDARTVRDAKTGREKKIIKDCSTWTWKMTNRAYGQVMAAIENDVNALNFGRDDAKLEGLRGTLAYQRRRPLFSGVRSQVLQLHREADSQWGLVRKAWLARYTQFALKYGDNAGRLRSLKEITSQHLPKMGRFKVFGDITLGHLVRGDVPRGSAGN